MNIIHARRVAQVFFFLLFLWFCVVSTLGGEWWQLRGWPINWFLQLDPLVALGTLLTTRTLYAGLIWALGTLALTILLGRFFCGWLCPFGALHQFVGWLGRRRRNYQERVRMNQYRPAQAIKYYILTAMIGAAAGGLLSDLVALPRRHAILSLGLAVAVAAGVGVTGRKAGAAKRAAFWFATLFAIWFGAGLVLRPNVFAASLQTGWLDPIPLTHRSVNMLILAGVGGAGTAPRFYAAGWTIGSVFLGAVLLNLWIPRFYCRFVCPLGALFGALVRWTPFRIGKRTRDCSECAACENHCEGACEPFGKIRPSECLLCMNCLHACRQAQMRYGPDRSSAGENESPAMTRRGFLAAAVSGVAAVPALRLAGALDHNWNPALVRPPGALDEKRFLDRCIKCGQCMRVCPTNVIQPALAQAGWEGVWTPVMNFRVGTSGCQLQCVACGQVCPTAALRPLTLDEKLGRGPFQSAGPVRIGTAFVDRNRCLPWAMDVPCIVCQENCPVSPKAIFVRETFQVIRDGVRTIRSASEFSATVDGPPWPSGKLGTGDYYLRLDGSEERRLIAANSGNVVTLAAPSGSSQPPSAGLRALIEVRLQRPEVDPARCIGCGVCQHECPVSGLRAIRVTAENETRARRHSLTPGAI